ncbi:MAG TPA: CAP domain-containing protein [Acidobacteriaceae bacterium]|nr:CAP domain-containing protein [Acidobacteriaceae bacterium]
MLSRIFLCVVLLLSVGSVWSQAPRNVAEQYLFNAANAERQVRGLVPLRWDESLYRAAWLHAREMAERESISHQYAGEPELSERAQSAGARFSVVAENVAEAPTALMIHEGWMESEHHRDNLLDPRLDRIAICVLMRDGELYAVQDFDHGVAVMSFDQQEGAVANLLAQTAPVNVRPGSEEARETCKMDTGYAGTRRPWFVMRFTTSELDALPAELRSRLSTGKYREALVGACPARGVGRFTSYNIAVLLYP